MRFLAVMIINNQCLGFSIILIPLPPPLLKDKTGLSP